MEDVIEPILEKLLSNPMNIVIAAGIGLFFFLFLLKKLFKIAMFFVFLFVVYGGYLYVTGVDASTALEKGKAVIEDIDEATQEARDDAIDKIIDEMEEQLKETSKKK
jgi:hypothetical protein